MVDIFGEVDEQIRADRLRTLVQRAVPVFIAALVLSVLAVLGVWGFQKYQTAQSDKASQAYADALDTVAKDETKAFDQFGAVAKGSGAYAALALMQQAGIRVDQNRLPEAAQLLDKAAAASKNPMIADAAALKSAYLQLDNASLQAMTDKLTPLAKPERPYHAQAKEALAMAKLAAGKTKEAASDLVALSNLLDTPDGVRQRAQAVQALIDSGSGAKLKALEQASRTAAPIPIAPPPQAGGEGAPQDPAAQSAPGAPQ